MNEICAASSHFCRKGPISGLPVGCRQAFGAVQGHGDERGQILHLLAQKSFLCELEYLL